MIQQNLPPEPALLDTKHHVLLFSDFYGVLSVGNNMKYLSKSCPFCIDMNSINVDNINKFLLAYNTNMIVTSTWRTIYQPLALSHILRSAGAKVHDVEMSFIDNDPMNVNMPKTIETYIQQFETKPVYIILDDNNSFSYHEYFDDDHYLFVSRAYAQNGFQDHHIDRLFDMVEKQIAEWEETNQDTFSGRK